MNIRKITGVLIGLPLSLLLAGAAAATDLNRTNFQVDKLSCGSCLSKIEAELKTIPGAIGMQADLRNGLVTVDHSSTLAEKEIASAITGLGYPARPLTTWAITEQDAISFSDEDKTPRGGSDCGSSGCGGCNATVSTWKELFNRYFGKTADNR